MVPDRRNDTMSRKNKGLSRKIVRIKELGHRESKNRNNESGPSLEKGLDNHVQTKGTVVRMQNNAW